MDEPDETGLDGRSDVKIIVKKIRIYSAKKGKFSLLKFYKKNLENVSDRVVTLSEKNWM